MLILSSLYLCAVSRDRGERFDDKKNISSLLEEAHSWNEATMDLKFEKVAVDAVCYMLYDDEILYQ